MSILDNLLGGGNGSNEQSSADSFESVIGTSPGLGFHASDVLHASSSEGDDGDSSEFTGIGDIGLDFSAPTVIGLSGSSEQSSSGDSDSGGGLLGGLL